MLGAMTEMECFSSVSSVYALMLQVALHDDGSSYQYEDLSIVENSPVNSDLLFNANHSHLYVMTTNKVCVCSDNSTTVPVTLL